jgi:beta-aspartyl-peptidase (threonine type)
VADDHELRRLLSLPTRPALVVHGGAWTRPGADPRPYEEGCAIAAEAGFRVLTSGGSALEAVEAAVVVLEDDARFNAGRGSCLTSDGTVEMDASIMWGPALEAGAVASVRGVRNPIRLARRVMRESGHVLLGGAGAERFARECGERFEEEGWFVTPAARARFEELAAEAMRSAAVDRSKLGTVGAVAVDLRGHVAAATSTGGTAFKRAGRVGDTPIVGAGTYADDAGGAVSCTGHGESILKLALAKAASDEMTRGRSPLEAAEACAALLRNRLNGDGGLITVAADGRAGWAMNTGRMSRAFLRGGMAGPVAKVEP